MTATGSSVGGGNTSRIQIENKSKNRFWESLEKNLKDLLHETDKVFPEVQRKPLSSRMPQSTTGTGAPPPLNTAVRTPGQCRTWQAARTGRAAEQRYGSREAHDLPRSGVGHRQSGIRHHHGVTSRQHEKVQEFLDRVLSNARRQVLIEATIVEVELSDGYQQGIEWSRLRDGKTSGTNVGPSDGTPGFTVSQPTLGGSATSSVTPFVFSWLKKDPLNLLTTVNLLQSFGNLKVLSSPKLTVLNNQTANAQGLRGICLFQRQGG